MSACGGKSAQEDVKDIEMRTKSINGNVSNSRAFCGVCKRMYREPKLLSCLHTFCADCIRQLEPLSAQGESPGRERLQSLTVLLCPECDSEVELPHSGVDGLTTDHLALDEVFMETLLLDNSAVCDLCGDAEAEQRCEVCSLNLCDFCSQAHRSVYSPIMHVNTQGNARAKVSIASQQNGEKHIHKVSPLYHTFRNKPWRFLLKTRIVANATWYPLLLNSDS